MRKEGWEDKLTETVQGLTEKKFEWGVNDCYMFPMKWVKESTGVDYVTRYQGKYNSKKSAYKFLKEQAMIVSNGVGEKMSDMLDAWGFKKIPPTLASRGDIVMFNIKNVETYGVCVGKMSCLLGVKGNSFLETLKADGAWKVE